MRDIFSTMSSVVLPDRPPRLPISKTCIYKTIGKLSIPVDIYFPVDITGDVSPVVLFIHGGGWIGGNREDYSRPMFQEFLSRGCIILSMDYRLLPESSFSVQLEDIRDIEPWIRSQLPAEIDRPGLRCDTDKIIVVGGSAGAHLALLTPKLWTRPPAAILSMYGPTNFHSVPHLRRGRISRMAVQCLTPELLAEATDYSHPPTEIEIAATEADLQKPRHQISVNFFRGGLVTEFLLRGLVRDQSGKLRFPERGSVTEEEIDEISPLQLCRHVKYPPVYQAMGTNDEIFDISQVNHFHQALESQGIPCKKVILPGLLHAFDVREDVGSEIHLNVLRPAVRWVIDHAEVKGD